MTKRGAKQGGVQTARPIRPSAKTVARINGPEERTYRAHTRTRRTTPEQRAEAYRLYIGGRGTLREIAAGLGISEGRMSQIVAEYALKEGRTQ